MFALIWSFMLFTSTFAYFIIAGIEIVQEAANLAILLFVFSIAFCSVLASPTALPAFWGRSCTASVRSPISYLRCWELASRIRR